MNKEASGMLGILNRGGMIAFGPSVPGAMKKGHLLLLASDASPRSKKELLSSAENMGVEVLFVPSKEELGLPLGRDELSAVLILSKKGASSVKEKLMKGASK